MVERVKISQGGIIDTFIMLDGIAEVLGNTSFLWPFLESHNGALTPVQSYSPGSLTFPVLNLTPSDEAAALALESEFAPFKHVGGIHSYYFGGPTPNNHLNGADHASLSFGDGTVDTPFSVGCWIKPDSLATAVSLIAKYDAGVGVAREWNFGFNTSGRLTFELYDESADATEIATQPAGNDMVVNRWYHAVATYDGNEVSPVVTFYLNNVVVSTAGGPSTETGAYVAMENLATPITIGCDGLTGVPRQEFTGRLALPFVCPQALDAGEVAKVYKISRAILGIG